MAERRERAAPSRPAGGDEPAALARAIVRTIAGAESALDAEVWASNLLGTFWASLCSLPFPDAAELDPALLYGEPLVRELARSDDPAAALAVAAIAGVEDGELGVLARELLDSANLWRRLPAWATDIGESEIVGAAVMRDCVFDDARTVLLESRHADGQLLAVGVLIDRNLGGIAKDVLLADSIDFVAGTLAARGAADGGELVLERIAPGVAAGLISEALSMTDMTWDPPVHEDYWSGRALARLRADQTSGVVNSPDQTELPQARKDALRDEFLASPEGAGFEPDGDEAWVAVLAIDFAANDAGGEPLRWSPIVVELFMVDWVPRKVMTTDALLSVLPRALDAWVRFAAGKRQLPSWALELNRAAITDVAGEMRARASDPLVGGPSKQFLLAAQGAGIDLGDAAALDSFVAGWNARSELHLGAATGDVAPAAGKRDRTATVLQVKVTIAGVSKPPVWRRIQLDAGTRLAELHELLQAAFGWEGYHLHLFECRRGSFGPVDPELDLTFDGDERDVALGELISDPGDRLTYTYDFGDSWQHAIVVEQALEPLPGVSYPVLVAAKGAGPPEDCGGRWGYAELKAVLADPNSGQHQYVREWLGLAGSEAFDPARVDLEAIQERLADLVASRTIS